MEREELKAHPSEIDARTLRVRQKHFNRERQTLTTSEETEEEGRVEREEEENEAKKKTIIIFRASNSSCRLVIHNSFNTVSQYTQSLTKLENTQKR